MIRLPEHASIAPATEDAIKYIIDHPRPLDTETVRRLGMTRDEHLDAIMAARSQVVSFKGEPVLYFHTLMHPQAEHVVLYGAGCTPKVSEFPVTFTRCARQILREGIEAFPDRFHMTVVAEGWFNHRWLNAIGFRDTGLIAPFPHGPMLWLNAHTPLHLLAQIPEQAAA